MWMAPVSGLLLEIVSTTLDVTRIHMLLRIGGKSFSMSFPQFLYFQCAKTLKWFLRITILGLKGFRNSFTHYVQEGKMLPVDLFEFICY
jgi:hypothetical protein